MRIGQLSDRTGIPVPTLRSWERRYGLVSPRRTSGGHRVYSEADLERILTVRDLVSKGMTAGAAAAAVRDGQAGPGAGPTAEPGEIEAAADDLWKAVDRFDAGRASDVVDTAIEQLGVPVFLDGVAAPIMRRLGATWRENDRAIAREHLASQLIRARLGAILREHRSRELEVVIAACPQGEYHDLGVLMAAVRLDVEGYRVRFLGAHTPLSALNAAVSALQPSLVLVGAALSRPARAFAAAVRVGPGARVLVGGDGFVDVPLPDQGNVLRYEGPYADLPAYIRQKTGR